MNNYATQAMVGASALNREAADNPFKLIYRLVDTHPGMDKNALFDLFLDELAECEEFKRAVALYFFTNAYTYATGVRTSRLSPIERAQGKAQTREHADSIKAQIVMLDLTMTNGKLLGDCTGAEVATLGNRFQKLAARVGKAKTVRAVLSEDQVKAIMK